MSEKDPETTGFQIFRHREAPSLAEAECMEMAPFTPVQQEGMEKLVSAGVLEGDEIRVLCDIPGFSLTHIWFKPGYPLPLHSHNVDCLYYIIAGTIRLGNQTLGERDSFFIPAGTPYTYKPGESGVELLEIRHEGHFNFVNLAKNAAFWDKAAANVKEQQANWKTAKRPTLNA